MICLLASIFLALTIHILGANPSCKVIKGLTALDQRVFSVSFGNRLDALINGSPNVPGAARFDNPELGQRWDAMLQVRYGLGNCERHWPGVADDETMEKFSEMLLSKRVIDAAEVDYETVGAGFGKTMARYSNSTKDHNEWARQYLDKLKNRLGEEPFLSAGYTEAQYFRDIDALFAEFPSGDGYPTNLEVKKFIDNQTNAADTGIFVEARAAASRKSEGILRLSVDDTWDKLPGVNTGIDILTNQGAYNFGRSYRTITGKLTNTPDAPLKLNHIAQAIVKARAEGKPYKFVIGVPEAGGFPADLTEKLRLLNAEIRSLPDVPVDFPEFTAADIIVESFE